MAVIRKAIVKRSDLPPLVIQEAGESKQITILSVQTTTFNSKPAFLYTASQQHNFKKGDTVEIIQITSGAPSPFAFENIEVVFVPSNNLAQFYVYGDSATPYNIADQLVVIKIPESYYVRYRIVSEDFNRNSHWSPLYALNGLYQDYETLSNISIKFNIPDPADLTTAFVFVNWDMPNQSISTQNYDIYVAWGDGSNSVEGYYYYATVAGNQITIPLGATSSLSPSSIISGKFAIQISTLPLKKRVSSLTVAESAIVDLYANS